MTKATVRTKSRADKPLIKKGTDLDYGARPLRRAIENRIEDPLAEELLRGTFQGMDTIIVDAVWDKNHEKIVRLDFKSEKRQPDPPAEPVGASATGGDAPESDGGE